jgi:phage-related minor tail protein
MSETKEITDGVNMDITNIREKFQEHLKELRSMQSQMKQCKSLTESALTLANQNQQYSQKNNIKFLGWK